MNHPKCDTAKDCIISECANGCSWAKAPSADTPPADQYNYIDGYISEKVGASGALRGGTREGVEPLIEGTIT